MERKDIKRLIKAIIGVGVLLLIILVAKPQDRIKTADNSLPSPIKERGGSCWFVCERGRDCGTFSLAKPIFYILKDNPVKEYYGVFHTFWITREEAKNMSCYSSEEAVQADGYKPSERVKRGLAAFEWLNKSWEERNATDTAKTLQAIDAVLGL